MTFSGPPYTRAENISFGDMGVPSYVNLENVIAQAARDMDAMIGLRYELPLRLSDANPEQLPVIYLLEKINRYLTIGRVVIDSAIGGEDTQLQAYGNYHLRQAESILKQIAEGKVEIPGQKLLASLQSEKQTGPQIFTKEPESLVDKFYEGDPFMQKAIDGWWPR